MIIPKSHQIVIMGVMRCGGVAGWMGWPLAAAGASSPQSSDRCDRLPPTAESRVIWSPILNKAWHRSHRIMFFPHTPPAVTPPLTYKFRHNTTTPLVYHHPSCAVLISSHHRTSSCLVTAALLPTVSTPLTSDQPSQMTFLQSSHMSLPLWLLGCTMSTSVSSCTMPLGWSSWRAVVNAAVNGSKCIFPSPSCRPETDPLYRTPLQHQAPLTLSHPP